MEGTVQVAWRNDSLSLSLSLSDSLEEETLFSRPPGGETALQSHETGWSASDLPTLQQQFPIEANLIKSVADYFSIQKFYAVSL